MELNQAQLWCFGLIALSSVIFMVLERIFPYNPGGKLLRPGFWVDMIGYNFFQSALLGLVISEVIQWFDSSSGISQLGLISGWPVYVQVLFFLVTHDFYIYWMHRLQHRSSVLWRIHEAHHATEDVDWLSGVRSHPIEILINQTVEFLPIVLLGAAPEVAAYKGLVSAVWGMYIHSNLSIKVGWLQYIVNGPEMHRWHHAYGNNRAMNKNFSTKFAIWDWIFGTAFLPKNELAIRYGIGDELFPKSYLSQLLYAFRREPDRELKLAASYE